jgi:hypothetical protein
VKWQVFQEWFGLGFKLGLRRFARLTQGQYVPFSGTCFQFFGEGGMPVDLIALFSAMFSIFSNSPIVLTPDTTPVLKVDSS